jgi:hypothetical protein
MGHRNGNKELLSETVFQENKVLSLLALWIQASKARRRDLWMGLSAVTLPRTLPQMWQNNNACSVTDSIVLSASSRLCS